MVILDLSLDVIEFDDSKDVCFAIQVDNGTNIVHILDLDRDSYSLTNAVSDGFLRKILNRYKKTLPPRVYPFKAFKDYRFLLYATDGIVSEWKDGQHVYCDEKELYLDKYMEVMKERRSVTI